MGSAASALPNHTQHFSSNLHQDYTSTDAQGFTHYHRKLNPLTSINSHRHIFALALCSDATTESRRQVSVCASNTPPTHTFPGRSHPTPLQPETSAPASFLSAGKTVNNIIGSSRSETKHSLAKYFPSTFQFRDGSRQFARRYHEKPPESGSDLKTPLTDVQSSSVDGASDQLTHTDSQGKASMVNVGGKAVTCRTATACGKVILGPKAFHLVSANQLAKGDALAVARLAGIMGAKQTSSLIPLCHPLPLDHVCITLELLEEGHAVIVKASCQTAGRTGVEMEALTAVTVASLTLYDMCKSVSRDVVITDIKLLSKTGGQRGDFHR